MSNTMPITSLFADQRGFTIIEALIAIVILIIGIISLYAMQTGAIQANARADSISRLSNWATDRIEHAVAAQHDYDELTKNDPGNADTPARQFGLNDPKMQANNSEPDYLKLGFNCDTYEGDAPGINRADYCQESPDERGLIFFNIANDVPTAGVTTIRVKVVTRDFGQAVISTTTYFISRHQ